MKINEIITETQDLNEINLKKAVAGGTLALAAANLPFVGSYLDKFNSQVRPDHAAQIRKADNKSEASEIDRLVNIITSKYKNVDPALAREVVTLAKKHEKKFFPKAEDILAIIGIESSFRPHAVSKLKKDPAVGLTQIRPGVWGVEPSELRGDIQKQISLASDILSKYNSRLKDPEDAVHAYNVGPTALKQGRVNPSYVVKFKKERELYNK